MAHDQESADDAQADVLGAAWTPTEAKLMALYEALKELQQESDLAPHVDANVREALASIWQAVNNLALTDERPRI